MKLARCAFGSSRTNLRPKSRRNVKCRNSGQGLLMRVALWRPWRCPPPLEGVVGGCAGRRRAGRVYGPARGRSGSYTTATAPLVSGLFATGCRCAGRLDRRNGSVGDIPAAISTPMGMNPRIHQPRRLGASVSPEYVEVTPVVTIRARFGASDHIWGLIVSVTSACFSRGREKRYE